MSGLGYREAGVDIDAGERAVELIEPLASSTSRAGVVGGIGGFGGLFDLAASGHSDPLLVSSTDGVGTKALVASMAGRYDTIGIDLVAMCVDDLVCQGAEPLFFLDYVSVGSVWPDQIEALVSGVAAGCRTAGCALVGGEVAEHPGVMGEGEFDLVGFAVGAVDRDRVITGARVEVGDVLIGLPSPNPRSNGYSLARKVLFEIAGKEVGDSAWPGADRSVADVLLEPSVIYAPAVLALAASLDVRAVAHITGGGLPGNLSRVLPPGADAMVDTTTWTPPRVFDELAALGSISPDEMFRVFNMGVGMVVVVPVGGVDDAISCLVEQGHDAHVAGEIVAGTGRVHLRAGR